MPENQKEKSICILADTNVWRNTLMLRSALGSAMLYTVNSLGAKIIIPEVVEDEIRKHIFKLASEANEKIRKSFREIGAILGSHKPYELPNDEDINKAIENRFDEISKFSQKIPFTLDHAKRALYRVNEKIPPSSSKLQQFKDAAIWEAVLELGRKYIVYLVTNDGDFYQDKERKILNSILKEECINLGIDVHVYSDLSGCLTVLKNKYEEIEAHVSNNGLKITDIKNRDVTALITENHDQLAIEFKITFNCLDINSLPNDPKKDPYVKAEGDCYYVLSRNEAVDTRMHRIEAHWRDITGEEEQQRCHVYLHASSLFIGGKPAVPHIVRQEI
jgi:hypothetical protein